MKRRIFKWKLQVSSSIESPTNLCNVYLTHSSFNNVLIYKTLAKLITNYKLVTDIYLISTPNIYPKSTQTQLKDGSFLTFSWPVSYISYSSFTFPGAPHKIFFLFLPWLPCHFYLVIITTTFFDPLSLPHSLLLWAINIIRAPLEPLGIVLPWRTVVFRGPSIRHLWCRKALASLRVASLIV